MKPLLRAAIVFALCLGVVAVFYHNTLFPLNRLVEYHGDCAQMVWNLWMSEHAISECRNPFVTDQTYWPIGANLAHHTLASGYFPLVKVVTVFTGHEAESYIISYNLCLWFSTALTLWFTYRCLRELDVGPAEAVAPSLAFALCPFLKANLFNLNHVSAFFIPLCVWLGVRTYRQPSRSGILCLCSAIGLAFYFTEFIAYLFILGLLSIAFLLIQHAPRQRALEIVSRHGVSLGIGVLLATVIATPFLWHFFLSPVPPYDVAEHSKHSANLAAFVVPSRQATTLYGDVFEPISRQITIGTTGSRSFLGFPLLILGVAGFGLLPRPWNRGVAAAFLIFLVLCLGPFLKVFSTQYDFAMPYRWIMDHPPLRGSRTPDRLLVMALFLLTLSAGWSLRIIALKCSGHRVARAFVAILFTLWVGFETYTASGPKGKWDYSPALAGIKEGPVLTIPFDMIHGFVGLSQIVHRQPTISGPVVRLSMLMNDHWWRMHNALAANNREGARYLDQLKVANILILPTAAADQRVATELTTAVSATDLPVVDLRMPPLVFPELNAPMPRRSHDPAAIGRRLLQGEPLVLVAPIPFRATSVECSLRNVTRCQLQFSRGSTVLGSVTLEPPASDAGSFVVQLAALPASVAGVEFDCVVISTADSAAAIGHLHLR